MYIFSRCEAVISPNSLLCINNSEINEITAGLPVVSFNIYIYELLDILQLVIVAGVEETLHRFQV